MKILKFSMTKKRALEFGLLTCSCGHPENNHFSSVNTSCAHCDCKAFAEQGREGVVLERRTAVALFAQGDYEGLFWFDTGAEASAFAKGFQIGCRLNGAGSAFGYRLPGEAADLRRDHPRDAEDILKTFEAGQEA